MADGSIGSPHGAASILFVANAYTNHVIKNTSYLDTGDFEGIRAAARDAAHTADLIANAHVDVVCAPGRYVVPAGFVLRLPEKVRLRGAGRGRTVFVIPAGSASEQAWASILCGGDRSGVSGITFEVSGVDDSAFDSSSYIGVITVTGQDCAISDVELTASGALAFSAAYSAYAFIRVPANGATPRVDIRDVYVDFAGVTWVSTFTEFYAVLFDAPTITMQAVAGLSTARPLVKGVTMRMPALAPAAYWSAFWGAVASWTVVNVDVEGVDAVNTHVGVDVELIGAAAVTTAGPRIRAVSCVGMVGNGGVNPVIVRCVSGSASSRIYGVAIDGVSYTYDDTGSKTSGAELQVGIRSGYKGEIHGVAISNVLFSDRSASGAYVDRVVVRAPDAGNVVKGVSISAVHIDAYRSGAGYGGKIDLEAAAGTLSDVTITACTVDECSVGAGIAKAVLVGNRMRAAFTDAGTGTIGGATLNAIG